MSVLYYLYIHEEMLSIEKDLLHLLRHIKTYRRHIIVSVISEKFDSFFFFRQVVRNQQSVGLYACKKKGKISDVVVWKIPQTIDDADSRQRKDASEYLIT